MRCVENVCFFSHDMHSRVVSIATLDLATNNGLRIQICSSEASDRPSHTGLPAACNAGDCLLFQSDMRSHDTLPSFRSSGHDTLTSSGALGTTVVYSALGYNRVYGPN